MNTFSYELYINKKTYNIYVDSSKDDWKIIKINGQIVVKEKYTLSLNSKAYIIYYPIQIDGREIVISIDDNPLKHTYNIYLDKKSLLDSTLLENDYLKSNKIIKNGFLCFARQNWKKILLDNMLSFVAISVFLAIMDGYLIKDIALKIIISTFLIISVFPIFILIEWLGHRDIIRKYHNCFRPKLYMIKNKGTENREYRFVTDEVINKK